MTPGVGTILAGKYQVERVLGEGGFGVVVAATHLQLHQRVALKFLLPHALRERAVVERFMREARAMAGIKSQHVARVIDIGTLPNGAPYIVMEYLEGRDLADVVAKEGPLSAGAAAAAVLEACEALAEAHALGIVHRDLKPANLFRARGSGGAPVIKVLDFGISKMAMGPAEDYSLTKTHMVLGSPVYASPEQLRSTKHVDHRTDIWSLGATLYQLASGTVPFTGETISELSIKVAMDPTPAFSAHLRIPHEFETIVRKCLEKDPAARFQSIVELAAALAKITHDWGEETLTRRISKSLGLPVERRSTAPPVLAEAITTQRGATGEVAASLTAGVWSRRKKVAVSVCAGLVVGGLASIGVVTMDPRGQRERKLGSAAGPSAVTVPGENPRLDAPPADKTIAAVPATLVDKTATASSSPEGRSLPEKDSPSAPASSSSAVVAPSSVPVAQAAPMAPVQAAPPEKEQPSAHSENLVPARARRVDPPKEYHELVRDADGLAYAGNCRSATRLYESAIDQRPGGYEALTGLGYCQVDAKEYEKALSTFRAALAISERYPEALLGMAEVTQRQGKRSDAITYYKRYLEQAPNGSRAAIARRELKALAAASAETAASAPSSGLKAQPVSASTKSQTDATKPMRRPRATEGPAPASLRSPPESVPTPAKTEDTCRVDDVLCQYRRSQHGPATGEKK